MSWSGSTGRSPSVTWSIAPDFALNWQKYLKSTLFNQYSTEYIKIIHQLVDQVYSLVPLAMANHRLARQMPRSWIIFSYYCLTIMIQAYRHFTFSASLTKAMVHCIYTCDTQLWHFLRVALLPTGRLRVSKNFSSRFQSKTRWPHLVYSMNPTFGFRPQFAYRSKNSLTNEVSLHSSLSWNFSSFWCVTEGNFLLKDYQHNTFFPAREKLFQRINPSYCIPKTFFLRALTNWFVWYSRISSSNDHRRRWRFWSCIMKWISSLKTTFLHRSCPILVPFRTLI